VNVSRQRLLALAVAVVATALVASIAIPRMETDGAAAVVLRQTFDKNAPAPDVSRNFTRTGSGYFVAPGGRGRVTVPVHIPSQAGAQDYLFIYGQSPNPGSTRVTLVGSNGSKRSLGEASDWSAQPLNVTSLLDSGPLKVVLSTVNRSPTAYRVLAGVKATATPDSTIIEASEALVAFLLALAMATLLLATRKIDVHWPLVGVTGLAAYFFWSEAVGMSFNPLLGEARVLQAMVVEASWFGLDDGLLTGSSLVSSPLAVQLHHALTPIVGTGSSAARAGSALLAVAAVIAVYFAANRAAGRWPAAFVSILMIIADPFRLAAGTGSSVSVLVLAAALLVLAIHMCLARATVTSVSVLGFSGLLIVLANPLWLPGMFLAAGFLGYRYAEEGERMKMAAISLLILTLLTLPNRVSTMDQNGGDPFADVRSRSEAARLDELVADKEIVGAQPQIDSIPALISSTASGARGATDALAARPETGLAALIAFLPLAIGSLFLLILPRLRMLILLPLVVSAPVLFLAGEEAVDPLTAGAGIWPGMLVAAAIMAFAANELARSRIGTRHRD